MKKKEKGKKAKGKTVSSHTAIVPLYFFTFLLLNYFFSVTRLT